MGKTRAIPAVLSLRPRMFLFHWVAKSKGAVCAISPPQSSVKEPNSIVVVIGVGASETTGKKAGTRGRSLEASSTPPPSTPLLLFPLLSFPHSLSLLQGPKM